jgi:hypothetical protein
MSAVLQSPALRAPVSMENLTAYIDSEIHKGIEKAVVPLKAKIAYLEAELIEVKSGLDDNKELLAISLKRNTQLENAIFEHDLDGELVRDDEDNPVLSHGLTVANGKPSEPEPEQEATPTIETTLDQKTCAVVNYLQTEAKPNDFGVFVLGRKELDTFMTTIIEEGLRVKKVSRQLKADLFERAVKLFPGVVYIKKSPSGNKTKLLALKTSVKCTITHT